jgi:hypothetical protein
VSVHCRNWFEGGFTIILIPQQLKLACGRWGMGEWSTVGTGLGTILAWRKIS